MNVKCGISLWWNKENREGREILGKLPGATRTRKMRLRLKETDLEETNARP
jgi:hypothetical protein